MSPSPVSLARTGPGGGTARPDGTGPAVARPVRDHPSTAPQAAA
ncbi:hypothetical protein [Frankia sp. CiP1_Cm_nod1]